MLDPVLQFGYVAGKQFLRPTAPVSFQVDPLLINPPTRKVCFERETQEVNQLELSCQVEK